MELATRSIFGQDKVRDKGMIKYYLARLFWPGRFLLPIPGDVNIRVPNEDIGIVLEFSRENEKVFSGLINIPFARHIPCKVGHFQYYAYITPDTSGKAPEITIYDIDEFEAVERRGSLGHYSDLSVQAETVHGEIGSEVMRIESDGAYELRIKYSPGGNKEERVTDLRELAVSRVGEGSGQRELENWDNFTLIPHLKTLWTGSTEIIKARISKAIRVIQMEFMGMLVTTSKERLESIDRVIIDNYIPKGDKPFLVADTAVSMGFTSVDLATALEKAGKNFRIISSDRMIKIRLVARNGCWAMFYSSGKLLAVRYKGSVYREGKFDDLPVTVIDGLYESYNSGHFSEFSRSSPEVEEYMRQHPERLYQAEIDAMDPNLDENKYEVVRCFNLFQYFNNTDRLKIVRNLGRTVKEGGYLIVGFGSEYIQYAVWRKNGNRLLRVDADREGADYLYGLINNPGMFRDIDLADLSGNLTPGEETRVYMDERFNRAVLGAGKTAREIAGALMSMAIDLSEGEKALLALDEDLGKEGTVNLIRSIEEELCGLKTDVDWKEIFGRITIIRGRGSALVRDVLSLTDESAGKDKIELSNVMLIAGSNGEIASASGAFRGEAIVTLIDDANLDMMSYYPFGEIVLFTVGKALLRRGIGAYSEEQLISLCKAMSIEMPEGDDCRKYVTSNVAKITLRRCEIFEYDEQRAIFANMSSVIRSL
ncbi:MAG: class I SAM-dependent methyltransferase [Candidatus Omnitrophica bacterium]|nr:class I SAM-dependent methyltransferase [Candidatus Omnitrophota bacterium]